MNLKVIPLRAGGYRLIHAANREALRRLARSAIAAAKRKDWRENHRLCRAHDDLAMRRELV